MVSLRHPTSMENLPNDVLPNIFKRLLAKQVAQIRCVCKPWNVLLSESSFVKSHLHHSIQNNDEILLVFDRVISDSRKPFTAHPSQSPGVESTSNIRFPVKSKDGFGRIIGSVNGLICFSYGSYHDGYVIHIWNPSLSAVLTLPSSSLHSQNSGNIHFWFGFDPQSDDYKVVKLTSLLNPRRMVPEVEVYSMRKGLWQLITQRFPSHITMIRDDDKVCVDGHNGHLHWLGYIGSEQKPETILSFDLGAETFTQMPLPDSVLYYNMNKPSNVLGVLGGKLCVMSKLSGGGWEVWVMDEYGVAESWVKRRVLVFPQFSGDIKPYGFTSHNEFIFEVGCQLYLYDPVAAQSKIFKITGRLGPLKITEYVDSLVWVAPDEHEPAQGHPSISISKRQLLKEGIQKATPLLIFYILLFLLCMITDVMFHD